MNITIIIVAFKNLDDVRACLHALENQSYRHFDIVICENGSQEDYLRLQEAIESEFAGKLPVKVINDPDNSGYAGGINRAIAAADDADAYWILNPDTQPAPNALAALLHRLHSAKADAVGGLIYLPDGLIRSCGGHWVAWAAYVKGLGLGRKLSDPPCPQEVEKSLSYISGACMFVSRNFVERTGPMREEYFLYAEEVEWCLRATGKGLKLAYSPDALIFHEQGSTTGSGEDASSRPALPIYLDERNKLLVVRDTTPIALLTAAPIAFAVLTVRYLFRGSVSQWRVAVSGWFAGLRNRRGKPRHLLASPARQRG